MRPAISLLKRLMCSSSSESKYVPVYNFPHIRVLAVVNRLKLYQTAFTLASIPASIGLSSNQILPPDAVWYAGCLGVSGCITLYSFGVLTNRFIGIIYYNDKEKLSKISYIDFWGNRKDKIIPVDDIVPLNELPTTATDGLFHTFRQFSTKSTMKLSMKHGIVMDKENFKKVL